MEKICESICIKTSIDKKTVYFLNVYLGQTKKDEGILMIKNFIETLNLKNAALITVGDFTQCSFSPKKLEKKVHSNH